MLIVQSNEKCRSALATKHGILSQKHFIYLFKTVYYNQGIYGGRKAELQKPFTYKNTKFSVHKFYIFTKKEEFFFRNVAYRGGDACAKL